MYAIELELFIQSNPQIVQHFNGIFHAEGRIPSYINYPSSYIFNTGDRWVAVYIDEFHRGEYFDSFGLPPPYKIFLFIQNATEKWSYNRHRIQSESSDYSGYYTLMYLIHRSSGQDIEGFTSLFSDCTDEEKDKRIGDLFSKSFNSSKIKSVKLAVEKMKSLYHRMENRTMWK